MSRGLPPITDTPGDLVMVLKAALQELEAIKATDPNNKASVDAVAEVTKISLEHWINLRTRRKKAN